MKKDKDFWIWTMEECIQDTYEWWGIDMMSMYGNIKDDFPNAVEAIRKIHKEFSEVDFYKASPLFFENVQYIYQAIANFIPQRKKLRFNIKTKELNEAYKSLNMIPWNEFVTIDRIDLLMAILLFTEEFIFEPVTSKNVVLTDTRLTVSEEFVVFEVSKNEENTVVSITVKDVINLQYVILN